jgi:hypothetical protein
MVVAVEDGTDVVGPVAGRGAVGQHAGAFGRKRIERVRFRRGVALTRRKAPIEPTEGHPNCNA